MDLPTKNLEGKLCCGPCRCVRPLSIFAGRNGKELKSCVKCRKASIKHYSKNRERISLYHRQRTYNMSASQFQTLLEMQKHKCAICRTAVTLSDHIDHDHATGEVRGILCASCNKGLGFFKDDVATLKQAIKYLSPEDRPKINLLFLLIDSIIKGSEVAKRGWPILRNVIDEERDLDGLELAKLELILEEQKLESGANLDPEVDFS